MTAEEKLKELYEKQRTAAGVYISANDIDLIANLVVERETKERRARWVMFKEKYCKTEKLPES